MVAEEKEKNASSQPSSRGKKAATVNPVVNSTLTSAKEQDNNLKMSALESRDKKNNYVKDDRKERKNEVKNSRDKKNNYMKDDRQESKNEVKNSRDKKNNYVKDDRQERKN